MEYTSVMDTNVGVNVVKQIVSAQGVMVINKVTLVSLHLELLFQLVCGAEQRGRGSRPSNRSPVHSITLYTSNWHQKIEI